MNDWPTPEGPPPPPAPVWPGADSAATTPDHTRRAKRRRNLAIVAVVAGAVAAIVALVLVQPAGNGVALPDDAPAGSIMAVGDHYSLVAAEDWEPLDVDLGGSLKRYWFVDPELGGVQGEVPNLMLGVEAVPPGVTLDDYWDITHEGVATIQVDRVGGASPRLESWVEPSSGR